MNARLFLPVVFLLSLLWPFASPSLAAPKTYVKDAPMEADEWTVTVTNAQYEEDNQELKIELDVERTGEQPAMPNGSFDFGIFGTDGVEIASDDNCSEGITYQNDSYFLRIAQGGRISLVPCFIIPSDQDEPGAMVTFFLTGDAVPEEDENYVYVMIPLSEPAPAKEPAPVVTVTISIGGKYLADPETCEPKGFYSDVRSGTYIEIFDDKGKLVYTSIFGSFIPEDRVCSSSFEVFPFYYDTTYVLRTDNHRLGRFEIERGTSSVSIELGINDERQTFR